MGATRLFVRDSLKVIFPDKADEIQASVDPGEYGMENWWCRWICCFLFMTAVVNDLFETISFANLLFHIPSRPETWISYDVPEVGLDKETIKERYDKTELDFVKFKTAGMPIS